jgi:hypothetical protein
MADDENKITSTVQLATDGSSDKDFSANSGMDVVGRVLSHILITPLL